MGGVLGRLGRVAPAASRRLALVVRPAAAGVSQWVGADKDLPHQSVRSARDPRVVLSTKGCRDDPNAFDLPRRCLRGRRRSRPARGRARGCAAPARLSGDGGVRPPVRTAHRPPAGVAVDGRASRPGGPLGPRGAHRQRLPDAAARAGAGRRGDAVPRLHHPGDDAPRPASRAADPAHGVAHAEPPSVGRPCADGPPRRAHRRGGAPDRRGAGRSRVVALRGDAAAARRRAVPQLVGPRRGVGRPRRAVRPARARRRGDDREPVHAAGDAAQLVRRPARRRRAGPLAGRRALAARRGRPRAAVARAAGGAPRRGRAFGWAAPSGAIPGCRRRAAGSRATSTASRR